jgi:hypothetical protein
VVLYSGSSFTSDGHTGASSSADRLWRMSRLSRLSLAPRGRCCTRDLRTGRFEQAREAAPRAAELARGVEAVAQVPRAMVWAAEAALELGTRRAPRPPLPRPTPWMRDRRPVLGGAGVVGPGPGRPPPPAGRPGRGPPGGGRGLLPTPARRLQVGRGHGRRRPPRTRPAGKVFCLVQVPDAESAARVHREAHGLVAGRIFALEEGA